MNSEVKQRWVDALRSGEYLQGFDALNINNKQFCCLGVLCELAVKEGLIAKQKLPNESKLYSYYVPGSFDSEDLAKTAILPKSVVTWAGLASYAAEKRIKGKIVALSGLNDAGTPFEEIADIIEQYY